jgi:hypothetical protein
MLPFDAARLKVHPMKATNAKSELKIETSTPTAAPKTVVHLALDVVDRGQSTAVAVLQDARIELRTAVDHGIELAEKLAAGTLRFARKLVSKIDEASNDALTGAERALSNAVITARETASRSGGELPAGQPS